MDEIFSRTALLIGEAGVQRLTEARVAVFGVGGVGSYTVEALARCGVGRMLLVDSDTVAPSNINRQLHATTATLGQSKVRLMARRVGEINPSAQVEAQEVFCTPDNCAQLLTGDLDYVVDAVDSVAAKLALVEECARRGIPIISAMGAGNKMDPTRFQVADIADTRVCPLCRVMRRELKKRGLSLKVVYSTEQPVTATPTAPGKQTPGSISFVPSVCGLILAGQVVRDLIGWQD